ncbi:MAG: c-type cytochrome [Myxococcota bacterium]
MKRRLLRVWLVVSASVLLSSFACSSSEPEDEACTVTAPTACPTPAVTYADVAPIFSTHCASCHTGIANAPWPFNEYKDAADWQELIRANILDCTMPPKDSGVRLSNEDRLKILTWVRCGAPP